MNVRDITGDAKIDRFGHKLYNDPNKANVFAGGAGRKGGAVDPKGNFIKPSKNESDVFNHLDGSDYRYVLERGKMSDYQA